MTEAIALDVHCHLVPLTPERTAGLEGIEWEGEALSIDGYVLASPSVYKVESLLAWMDKNGVERAWVSVPPPLYRLDLDEAATRAIRGGASGFLLKDADPEFLLASIRTVHAGNAVIAASATRELFEHFDGSQHRPAEPEAFAALTARERDIFVLAAKGLSNSEIATGEYLSEATVKTHISRILAKLGLRDRVQLVVFAFEHGLNE